MRDPNLAVLSLDSLFHGRYHVVRCIKAGGMGAVYEVVDQKTDTRRALKVMLPGIVEDAEMRARFAQEARVTGHIESDHIVRTSDAGVDEATGTPFLVMDLLRGEELGSLLERRETLPRGEVVAYLHQAALALDKTHAAGIVHRDLKPENLFLTRRDDGSPCLKILDFGIAKVTAQTHRGRSTKSIGTPLYMSPEQARGEAAIGPRSDLYTLGHIAYTLLVGQAYWESEWRASGALLPFFHEVVAGVREPPSERARRRGVSLPTAFDAWFLKATAVDAEDRFPRAGTAISALAEALEVAIPRPSMPDVGEGSDEPDSGVDPSGDWTDPVGDRTDRERLSGGTSLSDTEPATLSGGTERAPEVEPASITAPMLPANEPGPGRSPQRAPVILAGTALALAALVWLTVQRAGSPSLGAEVGVSDARNAVSISLPASARATAEVTASSPLSTSAPSARAASARAASSAAPAPSTSAKAPPAERAPAKAAARPAPSANPASGHEGFF